MLSSLSLGVKTKQYFVCSSNMFLHKKTVFKVWLNPGLNVTIFRGIRPRPIGLGSIFDLTTLNNQGLKMTKGAFDD